MKTFFLGMALACMALPAAAQQPVVVSIKRLSLDTALKGAKVTSDGQLPDGFPTKDVPLVDGTVLGGGSGPDGSGWVVQVRVGSVDEFPAAADALTGAGYTESVKRADSSSAFGLFRSDGYRVVLTFAKTDAGVTATYIVTSR